MEINNKVIELIQLVKDGALDDLLSAIEHNKKTYSDWRLPRIQELLTLVDYEKHTPACALQDTKDTYYWSSTTDASDTSYAWLVGFYDGSDGNDDKAYSYYVRCVRDGENGLEWSASSIKPMSWAEAHEYAANLIAPVYYKE